MNKKTKASDYARKRKVSRVKKLLIGAAVFIALYIVYVFLSSIITGHAPNSISRLQRVPVLGNLGSLFTSRTRLDGESKDRVNILVLGMAGAKYEGVYLTDTNIIASFKPSTGQIALVSFPRDLVVPVKGRGYPKINSLNAYGEADKKNNGANFASDILSDTFDIPIHYTVRIDFDGFRELVDEIGGLEVDVPRGFIDTQFPGPDFGFRTVSFSSGKQILSGQKSLEYARSRHGSNGEDSDFARARRQQIILAAIKTQLLNGDLIKSPKNIASLYRTVNEYVNTNFKISEMIRIIELVRNSDQTEVITRVIDNNPFGLLSEGNGPDGGYILHPKTFGNYDDLHDHVMNIFQLAGLKNENVSISINNGTNVTGLAWITAKYLEFVGLDIDEVGNAETKGQSKTTIEVKDDLDAPLTTDVISDLFNRHTAKMPPAADDATSTSTTDIIITLGEDWADTNITKGLIRSYNDNVERYNQDYTSTAPTIGARINITE